MAKIDIKYGSGKSESRTLEKSEPVSVGRHASSDVCVDEPGVPVLLCRISWNKTGYEVISAAANGVELNGSLIQHAMLKSGDVLRVGSADIRFIADDGKSSGVTQRASAGPVAEGSPIALSPVAGDVVSAVPAERKSASVPPAAQSAAAQPGKKPDRDAPAARSASANAEVFELGAADMIAPPAGSKKRTKEPLGSAAGWFDPELPIASAGTMQDRSKSQQPATSLDERLRMKRVRPGEEDTLRSPFVLILGGGALALLLAAFTVYFMINESQADRLVNRANSEMEGSRYAEAIQFYDIFLRDYGHHKRGGEGRINRGKCRVLRYTQSSTPDWPAALDALTEFIDENKELSGFNDLKPVVIEYAHKISVGAAKSAETSKAPVKERRALLATSDQARQLLDRYSSEENPATELLAEIKAATNTADAAILRQEVFEKSVTDVEAAVAKKQTIAAFDGRRALLARYPDFKSDRKLAALVEQTLKAEKDLVRAEEIARPAAADDPVAAAPKPVTLAYHTQSRTDRVSEGRVVIAVAKDCCYGIDTVTGKPVWRRVIGLDTPFFPISVSAGAPALLMFDANRLELLLVARDKGALVWRQPIEDGLSGAPLVDEGQIYVATRGGLLERINLDDGKLTGRLKFSQMLQGPPIVAGDAARLAIAGQSEVIYTVSKSPFVCETVSFSGHQPGAIKTPMLAMGALLLLADNNQADSTQLRVFDTRSESGRGAEIASVKVEGVVRDAPVLRGKQLFVVSSGQRVSSFTVSDDPNNPTLSPGPRYQGQSAYDGPIHLLAESDGQLWMAGNALRKLELKTDSFPEDPRRLAEGISTQPLQQIGKNLYVGRQTPRSGAVLFTQVDRDTITSEWRVVLGARVLEYAGEDANALVFGTEDATAFTVTRDDLNSGGFVVAAAAAPIDQSESLAAPMHVAKLSTGRLVAYVGGEKLTMWTLGAAGNIERRMPLSAPLEADPVDLDAGLVLPMPGKLRLGVGREQQPVKDYVAPIEQGVETKWFQLARLDGDQFLAVDTRGSLGRYQYRTAPMPHIALARNVDLPAPLDVRFALSGDHLALADAKARLALLDARNLDPVFETTLEDPASGNVSISANKLFVETGRTHLDCFTLAGGTTSRAWRVAIPAPLVGKPLVLPAGIVVALANGEVMLLDPKSGAVARKRSVGQLLTDGPRVAFGDLLLVVSIDGSVHRVESILKDAGPTEKATP